jgi:hypothetical protein
MPCASTKRREEESLHQGSKDRFNVADDSKDYNVGLNNFMI